MRSCCCVIAAGNVSLLDATELVCSTVDNFVGNEGHNYEHVSPFLEKLIVMDHNYASTKLESVVVNIVV